MKIEEAVDEVSVASSASEDIIVIDDGISETNNDHQTSKEIADSTRRKEEARNSHTAKEETTTTASKMTNDSSSSWVELMGEDLMIKSTETTTTTAEEPIAVQPQDVVLVDFVGRFAETKDDESGPIFHEATDWLVVVAEKDVVPALEMGIRFMHVGERALVWGKSKYAYGPIERRHAAYTLPAGSNVRYEVTVRQVVSGEERDDAAFQLRLGKSKKVIGNDAYANEWSKGEGRFKAIQQYKRGAQLLEFISNTAEDETVRSDAKDVMLDCLNNIVAVYLQAKEYHQAKAAAVKVLTHDPNNYKALMRAAKAALLDPASEFEEVEASLEAAAQVAPADDSELTKLRSQFKARQQEYKKKTKAMFAKMGGSILS